MFDAKDAIGQAVERGGRLVAQHNRGDVITWDEVETAAGFPRYSEHWTQFLKRLRRDVLNSARGIKLAAVPGVGVKLMTIEEQVTDISRQRRARRQLNRGGKELAALPDRQLTAHQRQMKHRKIDLMKEARRRADYALRVAHQLAKPSGIGVPRVRPTVAAT